MLVGMSKTAGEHLTARIGLHDRHRVVVLIEPFRPLRGCRDGRCHRRAQRRFVKGALHLGIDDSLDEDLSSADFHFSLFVVVMLDLPVVVMMDFD